VICAAPLQERRANQRLHHAPLCLWLWRSKRHARILAKAGALPEYGYSQHAAWLPKALAL